MIAVAAAAALAVVSLLLPWASVLFFSVDGIETADGTIVLVLIGVAGVLAAGRRTLFGIGQTVLCLAVAAIAAGDLAEIDRLAEDAGGLATAGAGIYLTLIAGIAWTVLALVTPRRR